MNENTKKTINLEANNTFDKSLSEPVNNKFTI